MSAYLRPRCPGGRIFFTVCLAHRGSRLLLDEIDILRDAVRVTRARRPFEIDAWVVLPDHMHAVWSLPDGDTNYSDRWGAIKSRFSKFVRLKHGGDMVGYKPTLHQNAAAARRVGFQPTTIAQMRAARSPSQIAKKDAGIWQRRFWEHHIRNEADYAAHVRYCWMNPVKHGLVAGPADWPYSSIHRDIQRGMVDPEFTGKTVWGKCS
ncbi:REP-associated tyrosine transposase [Marivita hallyeonensis]|uniref:Putative transposase n=1 Tax=Marivita hallyeonensis TaxID=996342 RepID=A0A1M5MWF8_9RHOB|nr:transposase [Marivita hallyeonensis]SHG81547.1 putative transposase [Marivita hallyeonensis]